MTDRLTAALTTLQEAAQETDAAELAALVTRLEAETVARPARRRGGRRA